MSTDRWRRRGSAPYRPIPELEEMRRRFEEDIVRPLMRSSPFRPSRELEDLRRRFEEDIVKPVTRAVYGHIPEEQKGWAPPVDVIETADAFIVKVELPGLKIEDVDVSVSEETLTIKGDRKEDAGLKQEDYFRSELVYGNFFRAIELPLAIDSRNIGAQYVDGILTVTLQKAIGAKPKKVNVEVKKGKD